MKREEAIVTAILHEAFPIFRSSPDPTRSKPNSAISSVTCRQASANSPMTVRLKSLDKAHKDIFSNVSYTKTNRNCEIGKRQMMLQGVSGVPGA